MSKWLLIDGNNALVRAMFAMQSNKSHLSSIDGIPTGALLVCINTFSRHIKEEKPTHVVVAWDDGHSNYRREIYPGYKSERREKSEEVAQSPFGLVKEFLSLANIHHVQRQGVEADDLIAFYCRTLSADDTAVIVSSDKDFLQLLRTGQIEQVRLGSANVETDRWNAARVSQDIGCRPDQIPLMMALTGDKGDGVPGIPGVGPKTALKLLAGHEWSMRALGESEHPKLFGREAEMVRNYALVNLRIPLPGLTLPPPPRFDPSGPGSLLWDPLLDFLERYQLRSVKQRLFDGSLWGPGHDRPHRLLDLS